MDDGDQSGVFDAGDDVAPRGSAPSVTSSGQPVVVEQGTRQEHDNVLEPANPSGNAAPQRGTTATDDPTTEQARGQQPQQDAPRAPNAGGGSGGGGGASSSRRGSRNGLGALGDNDDELMRQAKERGNKLFSQKLFGEAADAYTTALRYAADAEDTATLLSNRSAAYASLSQLYRSVPAARSERAALFDLDPSSLALMALKDAEKAVKMKPNWAKARSRQGLALYLCERYHDAREAYLEGLALEPTNQTLQEGLKQVQRVLLDGEASTPPQPYDSAAGSGTPAAAAAPPPSTTTSAAAAAAGAKRQRSLGVGVPRDTIDDWECVLCAKLLFEPVTTPCGHTFCRQCFARANDHSNRCPMCRTVLHVARELPITITMANILSRCFPNEYEERRREAAGQDDDGAHAGAAGTAGQPFSLPLFVMSVLMPGESMALNIFEPRYRLMVRRAMEGSRRLGMAQVQRSRHEVDDVAVEAEIVECQPQPDGRYYLELVGRRRVRLVGQSELDGYRVGRCVVMEDGPPPAPSSPEHETLTRLAQEVDRLMDTCMTHIRQLVNSNNGRVALRLRSVLESAGDKPPLEQHEKFSFWVSSLASNLLPDLDKVDLLRTTDTAQRLTTLREHLQQRAAGGGPGGCTIM